MPNREGSTPKMLPSRIPAAKSDNLLEEILGALMVLGLAAWGLTMVAIPLIAAIWVAVESFRGLEALWTLL